MLNHLSKMQLENSFQSSTRGKLGNVNLDHITVTKLLKCFRTNGCRK